MKIEEINKLSLVVGNSLAANKVWEADTKTGMIDNIVKICEGLSLSKEEIAYVVFTWGMI